MCDCFTFTQHWQRKICWARVLFQGMCVLTLMLSSVLLGFVYPTWQTYCWRLGLCAQPLDHCPELNRSLHLLWLHKDERVPSVVSTAWHPNILNRWKAFESMQSLGLPVSRAPAQWSFHFHVIWQWVPQLELFMTVQIVNRDEVGSIRIYLHFP